MTCASTFIAIVRSCSPSSFMPAHSASAPQTATFSADDPAMPAPAGDSPRVRSVRFSARKKRASLLEQRKAVAVRELLPARQPRQSSTCRSIRAGPCRPCARMISACARRLMAAFTVCACSWNRYRGQMSSVPPARSIRVGAELLICFMSGRTEQQNGHADGVAHLVDRRAVDDVRQETVAVRRHRDQIDAFLRRRS